MTTEATNSTKAVFEQHVQALATRNLDRVMQDYAEDAVIFAPIGVIKGSQNIRAFFKASLDVLTPEAMDALKFSKREFDGEYAYALWSAGMAVPFAGDLFLIRDGKIITQAIVQPISV